MPDTTLQSSSLAAVPLRRRSRRPWRLAVLMLAPVAATACGVLLYFLPGMTFQAPQAGQVTIDGQWLPDSMGYRLIQNEPYIPLKTVTTYIDPTLTYDAKQNELVIDTDGKTIRLATNQLAQWVNQHPVKLYASPLTVSGTIYVPTALLTALYPVSSTVTKAHILVLNHQNEASALAQMNASSRVHAGPGWRSPFRGTVKSGAVVDLWSETAGWARIQTGTGVVGYVPAGSLTFKGIQPAVVEKASPGYIPQRIMGQPVSLAFDALYSASMPSDLTAPTGVNTVSPTWFTLSSDSGHVDSLADPAYVDFAHAHHLQVWGLFSNSFSPARTHAMLSSAERRQAVESALVLQARLDHLDGINIDFEDMDLADRANFCAFLRELTALLHEEGVTVSVDITPISSSPNWSECYDRPTIASIVDYVVLMTYDEHTDPSDPGSVAGIPWMQDAVKSTLSQVPAQKLIGGIPLYTRLWEDDGGKRSVTALSINAEQRWLDAHHAKLTFDTSSGQTVAHVTDGQKTYDMWIEDQNTLQKRTEVLDQEGIAGIATWARGFGNDESWSALAKGIGFTLAATLHPKG